MIMKFYSLATQAYEVLSVAIYLLRTLPFGVWLNFWTTNKAETAVDLNGIKVLIRTKNLFTKSADISMAYECIVRDDYQLKHLNVAGGSFVIDIGGHIGSFSLAAAKKFPDAKILCFEPSAFNYKILKKNIELNNFDNISLFNKAVSSNEREVNIYINPINSAANSMYNPKGLSVKVPSTTLEKIFMENGIKKCPFMKMDCEGAEYDILLNTPDKVLKKIETMLIEYHSPEHFGISNKKYNVKNLVNQLKKSGFNCTLKNMKYYQGLLIAKR